MKGGALPAAVVAQARVELLLTLRRGESVLVTILIPLALLVAFASTRLLPGPARTVGYLLAATLALSVISTSLVSLGIATAYERYYGVLKQLGATPLPRSGLIGAKLLAVIALEIVQVVILAGIAALFYGWRPGGSFLLILLALLLGTAAFAGLGLLLAGSVRAEATLGIANGLFLFFLLLGGLFVPLSDLPAGLAAVARLLPAAPLADVLRAATEGGALSLSSVVTLVAWAVAAPLAASRAFRWE